MTFGQRLQHQVVRALAGLPPGVQVRLSGRPPVRLDGDTLAPEMQLSLRVLERRGETQPEAGSPTEARLARRRLAAVYAGTPVQVGSVADVEIDAAVPAPGAPLRAGRDRRPASDARLLPRRWVHVWRPRDPRRRLPDAVPPRRSPRPGGRLPPRSRASLPGGGARTRAQRLAGRTRTRPRSGPIRDGSGSAATARAAIWPRSSRNSRRMTAGRRRCLQLLIYPATDFTTRRRSRDLFGEGFLLSDPEMNWFETNYLGPERADASDPRASPLLADDLSRLAPALVVTAAFDPLRDEGEEYARALQRAGTPATLRRFPGFPTRSSPPPGSAAAAGMR